MLIKLLCGTELNPDHIIYIGHYNQDGNQVHFAQVVDHSFTLTDEELAQIRAYHTKTVVVDGFADGRYKEPITRPTKPFTVQDLPKDEQSLWMQKIYKLALEFIASSEKYFSDGVSLHAKECAGIAYLPDCSGAQYEKQVVRSCKSCAHLSSTVCPACGMSGFFPHWEPRA